MPDPDDVLLPAVTRWRRHIARRLDRRDPDDAGQDLALALLRALPGYRPDRSPLEGYLFGVLRHHHAKLRGRRRRRVAAESDSFADVADPRAAGERDADLRLDVAEAIARLDPGLARLADALTRVTLAEAAREWNVPRTTLQRRVEKLRIALDHLKTGGGP